MASLSPDGFVELNRTFSDFQENADGEQAAYDSYLAAYFGNETTWNDLLASRCCVVLAEAGSGKTWELLNRCQSVRDERRTAFFVRLELLARKPLEECLTPEEKRYFAKWKGGSDGGLFFLDAVDEAKLTTRHAFEAALRSFANGIGEDRIKRAKLVITSRISGWRNREDREFLCNLLDLPQGIDEQGGDSRQAAGAFDSSEEPAKAQPCRVVTMNVLSAEQVERQARHVIPDHADAFLEALAAHDAWSFVRRPQDVGRLAAYWQHENTFGNLTDVLEFDIQSRLRETEEDRRGDSDLTDDQLRSGAETLAAAVVFGKTFAIGLENEHISEGDKGNVEPGSELPDWTTDQHRALLTRALFDPAAYGLARFHHRSIAEYLAAQWLDRLLAGDLPVSDAISLFFVRSHGEEVLIPSRAAIACWLACGDKRWNRRIREKLLEISPEVLLVHGDGTRLDTATRENLLHAVVARANVEDGTHIEASNDQLKRLAHSDIASTITDFLIDPETPEEALLILLRLIREGQISECVPAALMLAANPASSSHAVTYASAAIATAGNTEEKEEFLSVLLAQPEIDERVACQVIQEFYPDSLSAESFVHLAEKIRPSGRRTFPDFAHDATEVIIKKSRDAELGSLLGGFVALLNQRPGITVNDKSTSFLISRDHIWPAPVLRAIVSRILAVKEVAHDPAEKIVEALLLIELAEELNRPFEHRKIDLQEPSFAHPDVRRLFCWRKAHAEMLRKPDTRIGIHHIFRYYTPLDCSEQDISWLLDDLGNEHPERHRETALHCLQDLWWGFPGRAKDVKADIRGRVRDNLHLSQLFKKRFPSGARYLIARAKSKLLRYWSWGYQTDLRKIKDEYWRWRNTVTLLSHLRKIRRGLHLNALIHLYERTRHGEAGNGPLDAIANRYNGWIAEAYVQGCRSFWRISTPPLRHEKDNPNSVPWGTIIGYEGLRFDLERGLGVASLSSEEADCAIRYTIEESDDLPNWFSDLIRVHSETVRSILTSCIEADWSLRSEEAWGSVVVNRLYSSGPSLQRLMVPGIRQMLRNADPGSSRILLNAVGVILRGDPSACPEITSLAGTRLSALPLDSPLAAPWLIIWLWLNAPDALTWLENASSSIPRDDVDALFLAVGNWMERNSLNPKPTDEQPNYYDLSSLSRLLRLCYRHVRIEDDIERAGTGTYSPGPRDRAQEFRNALLGRLIETPGLEAYETLLDFADDPVFSGHREYIRRSAFSRRRRDAEPDAWRPGDIAEFAASFVQPVRSGNDLFALTMRRVDKIKDDLEDADFRLREGLPTDGDEDRLQEWLAHQLDERSSNQYTVHREVLVAYGKKPDLRLETLSYPPTSIEVKWADSWSYNELAEALSDQLVGRYMRARRSRHGVMFLGWKREKSHWRPAAGEMVEFQELVDRLKDQAASILDERWDLDGLVVIGADFSG